MNYAEATLAFRAADAADYLAEQNGLDQDSVAPLEAAQEAEIDGSLAKLVNAVGHAGPVA